MTPDKIGKHAYAGSVAIVRCGNRRRSGIVAYCSGDGQKLYVRLYDKVGYNLSDNPVSVPADRVIEIKHGAGSTAPEYVKRQFVGGVR